MAKKDEDIDVADLITQQQAAEIRGVTLASINELVQRGRLRTVEMFGRKLVFRSEVESFTPHKRGPKPATTRKTVRQRGTKK